MWTRHSETWPKCMIHPCKLCIYFVNRNITNTVPSLTTLSDSPIKEVLCSSVASLSAWVLFCFCFPELPFDPHMAYGGDGEEDGISSRC